MILNINVAVMRQRQRDSDTKRDEMGVDAKVEVIHVKLPKTRAMVQKAV